MSTTPYPSWLERAAAYHNLAFTGATIVWKTVGLDWVPGFNQIFAKGYYPRRKTPEERRYNLFYLSLYGVAGLASQVSGMKLLGKDSLESPGDRKHHMIFGVVHTAYSIYHIVFAFSFDRGFGMSTAFASKPRAVAWAGRVMYCMELAVSLLFISGKYSRHRKITLDLASASNLLPLALYLPMTWFGFFDRRVVESIGSAFFVVFPFVLFAADLARPALSKDSEKEE